MGYLPSNLVKLHARKNKLPYMYLSNYLGNLKYANLRDNQISNIEEFKNVRTYYLENLNILGNPLVEEMGEALKIEILINSIDIFLPYLKRLNKEEVS